MGNGNASPASGGGEARVPGVEAIKHLAELGKQASGITVELISTEGLGEGLPKNVPVGWDRNNQRLVSLRQDIENFRIRPERRSGTAVMQTLRAFTALINRHKDADSAVFVDMNWKAPKFTAVIDYHRRGQEAGSAEGATGTQATPHEPRHLKHRLEYPFPLSEPWKAWVEQNAQPMDQGDFAAFIEDHISEIAAPNDREKVDLGQALFRTPIADPYEIVTLSRGLKISVGTEVGKMVTLSSGETEMVFSEVHRDGGNQKLVVPGLFMLSLPVFFRGELQRIPVRLRYRVAGPKVFWLYDIWRPDVYVTEALEKASDAVAVDTGLPVYEGAPEA